MSKRGLLIWTAFLMGSGVILLASGLVALNPAEEPERIARIRSAEKLLRAVEFRLGELERFRDDNLLVDVTPDGLVTVKLEGIGYSSYTKEMRVSELRERLESVKADAIAVFAGLGIDAAGPGVSYLWRDDEVDDWDRTREFRERRAKKVFLPMGVSLLIIATALWLLSLAPAAYRRIVRPVAISTLRRTDQVISKVGNEWRDVVSEARGDIPPGGVSQKHTLSVTSIAPTPSDSAPAQSIAPSPPQQH